MERLSQVFEFNADQLQDIKKRMLHLVKECNIFSFLDSNQYTHTYGKYECLLAFNPINVYGDEGGFSIEDLKHVHNATKDWLFGHIAYDFKNEILDKEPSTTNPIRFPNMTFFQPGVICYIPRLENKLVIESSEAAPSAIWEQLQQLPFEASEQSAHQQILLTKRVAHQQYLNAIQALKQHIIDGDCYEINFCNEAFATDIVIDPFLVFNKLNAISPNPFAGLYRLNTQYLICASPERYLYHGNRILVAQPIKGTRRRGATPNDDHLQVVALQESIKDRAENVMIVDLMRNDLARCSVLGSVIVEELCAVYTFPQVHQMISTIKGNLSEVLHPLDSIQCSFPMGSMTGAPKLKVMELIDQYESLNRNLFSGSIGYICPNGNFDFNVVIRSLFYDSNIRYLSYQTGGAITFDSHPEDEWQETCLKAAAIEKALQ